jgi:hypothetical protein
VFGVDMKAGLTTLASDNDAAEAAAAHSGRRYRYRIDFICLALFFMSVRRKIIANTSREAARMTKRFSKRTLKAAVFLSYHSR